MVWKCRGGFFSPAPLFKYVRLSWFSLSISSFQMLKFSPGGLSCCSEGNPCGKTPPVGFLQQYQGHSWQWCWLLKYPWQGHGSTRNSPCKPFCSGPCCRNPSGWVRDVCVMPAGLCSWLKVTRVHQVSISPDFCYTGLESSWEVFPACVVASGVFLHWLFPCGSTCGAGPQLTDGDSGITSTWKSTNCT